MRPALPSSLVLATLLAALLSACASTANAPARSVSQTGSLKVHPGLLGQPVPPELQTPDAPAAAPAVAAEAGKPGGEKLKLDEAGLRTQRSLYFDLNSADIKAEYAAMLQAHARHLSNNPNARVRIDGNADERGSAEYNKRLGLKRAEAVKQAMLAQGAPEKQVKVASLGEAKPKLKGHDEESWAENRRADIVYEKEN